MLKKFCKLFDSNDPSTMQKAVDEYADFATKESGIEVALTKTRYYLMYHANVASKLKEYLPQGLFAWKFGGDLTKVEPSNKTEASVVRSGTITFDMGYSKRHLFENLATRDLPKGQVFPYTKATKFDDCDKCPAKMLFKVKLGGLSGNATQGWKIVALKLIKLK